MLYYLKTWLEQVLGISVTYQDKLLYSFLVIVFLWLLRKFILFTVRRQIKEMRNLYLWQKGINYLIIGFGILVIGQIWLGGLTNLATFLGLLSAGIAIALKDLISNVVGWAYILLGRPFIVGDRIEINNVAGDVIDLGVFRFTLLEIGNWVDSDQSTGRIVHIPNGDIFNKVVANYSTGFQYIWNEIPVQLTINSNWEKAREILLAIATKHAGDLAGSAQEKIKQASQRFLIYYTTLTPTVYVNVKSSVITLTIRYLCEPRLRRISQDTIWQEILQDFRSVDDIFFVSEIQAPPN